jgi:hypothetical protein
LEALFQINRYDNPPRWLRALSGVQEKRIVPNSPQQPTSPPRPPGWRPEIVVVPMGQPVPPGPGVGWRLQFMKDRDNPRR